MITIREATDQDVSELAELSRQLGYPQANDENTSESLTAIQAISTEWLFVACIDEQVVGWMQLSDFMRLETGRFFEITGLVVDAKHRSAGVGRMLVEKAKAVCRQHGCKILRVRSNVERSNAHRFYESQGFSWKKDQKVFDLSPE